MGAYSNISFDQFPKQGSYFGKRVRVIFHYDSDRWLYGTLVRDDAESRKSGDAEQPGVSIIALDNGKFILTTECQYSIVKPNEVEKPYIEPGSIDDPQSVAYDMANAPFNEMPKPHDGYWWMEVDRDPIWMRANYALFSDRRASDLTAVRALAAKYGAKLLVGKDDTVTGRIELQAFLMADDVPKPGQRAFREQELKRARQRRANVWEYSHYSGNDWIMTPRTTTKLGREARRDLNNLSRDLLTGMCSFGSFILNYFGMVYEEGTHKQREIWTRVIYVGDKVFIGVPVEPESKFDLSGLPLIPVNYSDVVRTIELSSGAVEDSDDSIEKR